MARQREIDKRTGLKTKTRPFMLPVSESSFSADRIRFRDTGSVFLDYTIDNKNGFPVVDTDIVHLSGGNERYLNQREHFTYSERTTDTLYYNEFQPTIADNYRIRNGSLRIFINGVEQSSNTDQTASASADFFVDSTQKKVRIHTLTYDNYGVKLKSGSVVTEGDSNFLPPTTTGDGSESSIQISFQREASL
jgi:hypothetical protein